VSSHASAHREVGGPILTSPYRLLLAIAALGVVMMLWRFVAGLAAVSNLNDGYPWGIWIAFDVVTGTALGCGGYALAVLAVTVDLGRFWELWKVPVFFWRWSHSPQLEVALCVAAYVLVLLVELSPAFFEKWRRSPDTGLRSFAEKGAAFVKRYLVWILALGILLPTMHQSSLGTMMLLPGPKLHPLWSTPWLPFLFLVNCVIMGYGVVVLESHAAASAFGRRRETDMLGRLSKVAMWVALFFVAFRAVDILLRGQAGALASWYGLAVLLELGLLVAGAAILTSEASRRKPGPQATAALLLVLGGTVYRFNVYLVGFRPGDHWSYFPAVPELLITFGIVALEIALYVAAVKTFPILAGEPEPARA
jgi:Ni/Fe-hydrogenase subunit HybB-like protein